MSQKQSSVLLIYTGGTIGMKEDPVNQALRPFDFSALMEEVPELRKFDLRIDSYTFDPLIDSSDVEPAMWQELASLIRDNYSKYDGFVVLHGTDTMAYSASALSFMLEGLAKPVIFTGSQLPIGSMPVMKAASARAPSRLPEPKHPTSRPWCRKSASSLIRCCSGETAAQKWTPQASRHSVRQTSRHSLKQA